MSLKRIKTNLQYNFVFFSREFVTHYGGICVNLL